MKNLFELFQKFRDGFNISYAPDLRALSMMRICIALIGMIDIGIRFQDLEAHYSDSGILPLQTIGFPEYFYLKTYFIDNSIGTLRILYSIHFELYLILVLGIFPRLISFLLWMMTASLILRNPYITQGGDELLRMILLFGIFIPWGENYSIQSLWKKRKENPYHYSFIHFAFLIQIGVVYFFSAILKSSVEWKSDFSALWYALQLDQMVMPLGEMIREHYLLCQILTFLTIIFEWAIIILILSPYKRLRNMGALIILLFHVGIGLTLFVGLFFVISISVAIGTIDFKDLQKIRLFRAFKGSTSEVYIANEGLYKWILILRNGFIGFILVFILYHNNANSNLIPYKLDFGLDKPVSIFQIQQNWGMFAPAVFKNDGFIVAKGKMEDGYFIDVLRGGKAVSYKKPEHILDDIPNDRWRKYYEYYSGDDYAWLRSYYCEYLIKKWNKNHPKAMITSLEMEFIKEFTKPYPQKSILENIPLCTCSEGK